MKKIIIDKNMLIQLKHEIKLDELNAIYKLLELNYCIGILTKENGRDLSEIILSTKKELEEYLSNN